MNVTRERIKEQNVTTLHANIIENEAQTNMQQPAWCEIPLMSDDDYFPSPRGHLVFKGNSESESASDAVVESGIC